MLFKKIKFILILLLFYQTPVFSKSNSFEKIDSKNLSNYFSGIITFGNKNFGYYETICGGEGASEGHNGTDAVHCHMTNTSITDAEILEWNYPVRLLRFSIRKDSGGKGKWKGGNGSVREIEFLKNLDLTILSNRRLISPFGLKGGKKGKVGENYLKQKKSLKLLPSSCQIKVKKGHSIIIKTPGGGGFS